MPIVSSEIIDGPNIQADESVRGTIAYTFDTGLIENRTVRAESLIAFNALVITLIPDVELSLKNREIDQHLSSLNNNIDPYYYDAGGYYLENTFEYCTWDESFITNIKYFLAISVEYAQLELVKIKDTIDRTSNTVVKDLLLIDQTQASNINADIQVAVDIKAALSAYQPLFDEDGNQI